MAALMPRSKYATHGDGHLLFERGADEPFHPASTLPEATVDRKDRFLLNPALIQMLIFPQLTRIREHELLFSFIISLLGGLRLLSLVHYTNRRFHNAHRGSRDGRHTRDRSARLDCWR